MTLALMLGRADVDAMLSEMTARQYEEWRAFYQIEPFGPWRDSVNAAVVAQQVHNVLGGKAKLKSFIPTFGTRDTSKDWERVLRAWSETRNGGRNFVPPPGKA